MLKHLETGNDVLSQSSARVIVFRIARVHSVTLSVGLQSSNNRRSVDSEKRAQKLRAGGPHAAKPFKSRPSQQVQEQCLSLVVLGVSHDDGVARPFAQGMTKRLVPELPGRGLGREAVAGSIFDRRNAADVYRESEQFGKLSNKRFVCVRVLPPQVMVDVTDSQLPPMIRSDPDQRAQ